MSRFLKVFELPEYPDLEPIAEQKEKLKKIAVSIWTANLLLFTCFLHVVLGVI